MTEKREWKTGEIEKFGDIQHPLDPRHHLPDTRNKAIGETERQDQLQRREADAKFQIRKVG